MYPVHDLRNFFHNLEVSLKHTIKNRREPSKILSFGEIIFDQINGEYFLGGAPLNFAWYTSQISTETTLISAVGNDDRGRQAISKLKKTNIRTCIRVNDIETGTAVVHDESGNFDIISPAAWESIKPSDFECANIDLLYIGTLSQTTSNNRKELKKLLCYPIKYVFVDLNLRHPFYSKRIIENSLLMADILKVNVNEWNEIKNFEIASTPIELMDRFNISFFAVTKGCDGATLYTKTNILRYTPSKVTLVDATGSGDAFSAILAAGIIKDTDLTSTLKLACETGAFVATTKGAQTILTNNILSQFL